MKEWLLSFEFSEPIRVEIKQLNSPEITNK